MTDMEKDFENEELEGEEIEVEVLTLTDEETGDEKDFEKIGEAVIDGNTYLALVPANEETDEYVILRVDGDDDDMTLESIEDDEEFDRVADYFDDMLFGDAE